jgi:hypothetical protein
MNPLEKILRMAIINELVTMCNYLPSRQRLAPRIIEAVADNIIKEFFSQYTINTDTPTPEAVSRPAYLKDPRVTATPTTIDDLD